MRLQFLSRVVVAAMALAVSACGSDASGPGRINVRLMDGPSVDYAKINLDVREVQIHGAGGWEVLGTPNVVVDLLSLQGGVTATLVTEKQIEPGHYTQMRLVLGPENAVVLRGDGPEQDRTKPLVVPSGQQSGVKLNVNFDVQPDTTVDVVVDVHAERSIFVHRTGASEKYLLRPVVSAVDILLTGSIRGVLTDLTTGAGLPGVDVTAQTVENGLPVLVRSAKTAADGSYTLPFLPAGGTYHVVAQPLVRDTTGAVVTAYAAQASQPFLIVRESPTATWNGAFLTAQTGGVSGSIDPARADTQVDTVSLAQVLTAGGVSQPFIVQTTDGVLAQTESYAFSTVPVGDYTAWVTRRTISATLDPAGVADETIAVGPASVSFPVAPGVTAQVPLAAP